MNVGYNNSCICKAFYNSPSTFVSTILFYAYNKNVRSAEQVFVFSIKLRKADLLKVQ